MTVAVRTGFVSVTDTVNVPVRGASRLTEAVNVNVASPEPPVGLTVIPLSVSGDIVQSKPGVAITEPVTVLRPSTSISGSASVVLKEEGCCFIIIFPVGPPISSPARTVISPVRKEEFGFTSTSKVMSWALPVVRLPDVVPMSVIQSSFVTLAAQSKPAVE